MRISMFAVIALVFSTTHSGLANEAFVPQVSNAEHLVSEVKASVAQAADIMKIASPLQLAPGITTGQKVHAAPGVNYSSVVQYGTNNLAAIAQSGGNNLSAVAQYGTNNLAAITQSGGNNLSAVIQHGSGNQAIVSQRR